MRLAILATAAAVLALPVGATQRSREVPRQFQKEHPCPSTGKRYGACPGWIKDHIVPLCAGGADAVWNLQWQTVREARIKDREERRQCSHRGFLD